MLSNMLGSEFSERMSAALTFPDQGTPGGGTFLGLSFTGSSVTPGTPESSQAEEGRTSPERARPAAARDLPEGYRPADFREALEHYLAVCPDLLVTTDMEGMLLQWNPAWQTLLGLADADLQGRSCLDFVHPEDLAETRLAMLDIQNDKSLSRFVNRFRNSSGGYVYLEWHARPSGSLVYAAARNITKEYVQEKHIEYLSFHDQQTGLYNRRFLLEELRRLDTARNLPATVVMGDLNRLKLVNDAFGHEKGNELIRKAAQALRQGCRTEDLLARWGDDEFLLFLPRTDKAQAEMIVSRVLSNCEKESVNGIRLSVSFGIGTRLAMDEDMSETLRKAEEAMYAQKALDKRNSRGEIIKALTTAFYERDPQEEVHANHVSSLCRMTAVMLGLNPKEINKLALSGLMHDIGKIAVSTDVLEKPETLTEEEWAAVRQHPESGYRVVSSVQDMVEVGNAILAHHECWDGSGYPKGLKWDEIPLFARIIALAESYATMTLDCSYRTCMTRDEAVAEIRRNAGTQFDPELAEIFINRVILDRNFTV